MHERRKGGSAAEPATLRAYTALTAGLTPILHLSQPLLRRYGGFKDTVPERLGRFSPALDKLQDDRRERGLVWIHAVSVGEAAVAGAIIGALRARRGDALVAVSTGTLTGRDYARRNLSPDALFFFPLDLPSVMRKLVAKLRPDCFVDIEVELWPNCFRALGEAGVAMALANGRISDRAMYPPLIARSLYRWLLGRFDALFMRSEEDVRRAVALGAPKDRTHLAGDLKFAAAGGPLEPEERSSLRRFLGVGEGGKLLVAGSTHPGEEEKILEAWKRLNDGSLGANLGPVSLVIAPRHLEQVARVSGLVRQTGEGCALWTQSRDAGGVPEGVRVLVVDAIGELGRLYGAADAAFVGGSLVPRGGHNVLEPVAAGVPTLHGPWMDNFRDLVRILSPAGLVMEVLSADDLAKSLCRVLAEVDLGDFRRRARDVIERQVKAADMIGDWVAANLKASK